MFMVISIAVRGPGQGGQSVTGGHQHPMRLDTVGGQQPAELVGVAGVVGDQQHRHPLARAAHQELLI
jgi:hypothetical protein